MKKDAAECEEEVAGEEDVIRVLSRGVQASVLDRDSFAPSRDALSMGEGVSMSLSRAISDFLLIVSDRLG